MQKGASDEKIREIESWATSTYYSDAERVALDRRASDDLIGSIIKESDG